MVKRLHSWLQRADIRLIISGIVILICFIGLIFVGYWFHWPWTGFSAEDSEPKQHAKTLWDWLQLLVIPLMLAVGGFWFNQIQKEREQRIAQQQAELESKLTYDNQQESSLQTYIDKMSELLLEKQLRSSKPEDEVRKIARVRTLTVLSRLDGGRKGSVLQFLQDSGLIHRAAPIVDLRGADLRGVLLDESSLFEANLREAMLNKAVLSRVDLRGAILSKANLQGANLHGAVLCEADLSVADLREADLGVADLRGATLIGTDLGKALISSVQLDKVKSLQGAILPDGSKHS